MIQNKKPSYIFLIPVLLILAGVGVYANSLDGKFLFDDQHHIISNNSIRFLFPLSEHLDDRRPLVSLSLAVNYAISGLNTKSYHVFNIVIHISASIALYFLLLELIPLFRKNDEEKHSTALHRYFPVIFASLSALIFLVHPVQTQSVTYVIQRSESMMGLFYILSLLCGVKAMKSESPLKFWVLSFVFSVLSLMSKPVGVTIPIVLLLIDYCISKDSLLTGLKKRGAFYGLMFLSWTTLFIMGTVQGVSGMKKTTGPATVGFSVEEITPFQYFITQPEVIWRYIFISIWPFPPNYQCLDYDYPVADGITQALLPGFTLALIFIVSVYLLIKKQPAGLAGCIFFVILGPTSSFIPIRDVMFEHRMYLPLACLTGIVVAISMQIIFRMSQKKNNSKLGVMVVTLLLLVWTSGLMAKTVIRNKLYHDPEQMWAQIASRRPDSVRAKNNLANAYLLKQDSGLANEARKIYMEVLKKDEDNLNALSNLGLIYQDRGNLTEALFYYKQALKTDEKNAAVIGSIGRIKCMQKKYDEGLSYLKRALEINPKSVVLYDNLGQVYLEQGKEREALPYLLKAIELKPDFKNPYLNMAKGYYKLKEYKKAITWFQEFLKLEPRHPESYRLIGLSYLNLEEYNNGISTYQTYLKMIKTHTHKDYARVGRILAEKGKNQEAANWYQNAYQLSPDNLKQAYLNEINRLKQ